jgi:hypothetical protein
MKYLILRKFLSKQQCDLLVDSYKSELPSFKINLKDGGDLGNVEYSSTRSNNLRYKYTKSDHTISISNYAIDKLEGIFNVSFKGSINDVCLPMFGYGLGGNIKAHRGVQKERNNSKYQTFVAVCQLTQRGVDFDGGRFYINSRASASPDGKTVYGDNETDRIYPMLNKGDVCVIYNPILVHGVDVVEQSKSGSAFRLTCSWRSNNDQ